MVPLVGRICGECKGVTCKRNKELGIPIAWMEFPNPETGKMEFKEFWECPSHDLTPASHAFAEYFFFFRQGLPLRSGGLDDQPARWVKAMMILDEAVRQLAEADDKESS